MNIALDKVAKSQGLWSETAKVLKTSFERTRLIVLALSVAAALLAAVSSQSEGRPRQVLAVASTLCMGLVTFFTARLLDSSHSQKWVRARAASEAMKAQSYRRSASAAPYDNAATADQLLLDELNKIESDIDDLNGDRVNEGKSSAPVDLIKPTEYIEKRVTAQAKWHEDKAEAARTTSRKWLQLEFVLALATAVITAIIGSLDKKQLGAFDFVALTGVLTTLSGTILAHVEASRYAFIVSTYRATARRLRNEEVKAPANAQPPSADWSAFVERCEGILREQNNSWIAKFSQPK
jgi:hypothetical protein